MQFTGFLQLVEECRQPSYVLLDDTTLYQRTCPPWGPLTLTTLGSTILLLVNLEFHTY